MVVFSVGSHHSSSNWHVLSHPQLDDVVGEHGRLGVVIIDVYRRRSVPHSVNVVYLGSLRS